MGISSVLGLQHKRFWSTLLGGAETFSFLITKFFPNMIEEYMPQKLGSLKRRIRAKTLKVLFPMLDKHGKIQGIHYTNTNSEEINFNSLFYVLFDNWIYKLTFYVSQSLSTQSRLTQYTSQKCVQCSQARETMLCRISINSVCHCWYLSQL